MQKPVPYSEEELNQIFTRASDELNNGLLDSAQARFDLLLEYFPDAPILWSNLGLVYYEKEEFTKARKCFARGTDLQPEDRDIQFNLALCQKRCGDLSGAIASYKKILAVDSKSIDTLYNLAGCYKDSNQYPKAIETYLHLLDLSPDHPSAVNNLAYVYQRNGDGEHALCYYKKVLELNPDHQGAKHMLASLTGSHKKESSEEYVRDIFDNYSSHYEESLVSELEYSVPTTLRELVRESPVGKNKYRRGLDLGCGTGLGGVAFFDMVETLDGIDLSPRMLLIAAEKNIYHNLYEGRITDFPEKSKARYDFYLAADVFNYVGDLTETFNLLMEWASDDVIFCFSTEKYCGKDFQLQQTGRFAHSDNYIETVARETGWILESYNTTSLRKEKGASVQGGLWLLRMAVQ